MANQVADAVKALQALAADQRIDGTRIAILGMSSGGGAAVTTMAPWVVEAVLDPDSMLSFKPAKGSGLRFAAHVAFYPAMHLPPAAADISGEPLLLIVGDKDNWQTPERDRAWVDYVRRNNKAARIEFKIMPGAYHSFLDSSLPPYVLARDAFVAMTCPMSLASPQGGSLWLDGTVHAGLDRPAGDCTKRGLVAGYSREATQQSLRLTVDFLNRAFAAPR